MPRAADDEDKGHLYTWYSTISYLLFSGDVFINSLASMDRDHQYLRLTASHICR